MKRWLITVLPLGALVILVAIYGLQMARQAPAGAPVPTTVPAATLAPTLPPAPAAREVLIYDLGLG